MADSSTRFNALHRIWFGDLHNGWADETSRQRWFKEDALFDAELRRQFGTWLESLVLPVATQTTSAHDLLSMILSQDQLPRNLYRGTTRAFAFDESALRFSSDGLRRRLDAGLSFDERAFFYMPFMHSENIDDQSRSLELFTTLRDATPKGMRHITGGYLRSAQEHHRIITRFRRFPHRNEVLGRPSTAAERAWLDQSTKRFGQARQHPLERMETDQRFVDEPDK